MMSQVQGMVPGREQGCDVRLKRCVRVHVYTDLERSGGSSGGTDEDAISGERALRLQLNVEGMLELQKHCREKLLPLQLLLLCTSNANAEGIELFLHLFPPSANVDVPAKHGSNDNTAQHAAVSGRTSRQWPLQTNQHASKNPLVSYPAEEDRKSSTTSYYPQQARKHIWGRP